MVLQVDGLDWISGCLVFQCRLILLLRTAQTEPNNQTTETHTVNEVDCQLGASTFLENLQLQLNCENVTTFSTVSSLSELDEDDPIGEGGRQEGGDEASVHREEPTR